MVRIPSTQSSIPCQNAPGPTPSVQPPISVGIRSEASYLHTSASSAVRAADAMASSDRGRGIRGSVTVRRDVESSVRRDEAAVRVGRPDLAPLRTRHELHERPNLGPVDQRRREQTTADARGRLIRDRPEGARRSRCPRRSGYPVGTSLSTKLAWWYNQHSGSVSPVTLLRFSMWNSWLVPALVADQFRSAANEAGLEDRGRRPVGRPPSPPGW